MADLGAIAKLQPYLTGEVNNKSGEWGMRCPMPDHPDTKRSASVNFEKDTWYCQRCQKGGPIDKLLTLIEGLVGESAGPKVKKIVPLVNGEEITFHKVLMRDKALIKALQKRRGLSMQTLKDFNIGYDLVTRRYTIPVYDTHGTLVNIRKYDPTAQGGDKMVSVMGHGAPYLYPLQQLSAEGEVIICEGELDALTLIQAGFTAITRTGAAAVWLEEWSEHLFGRDVYVCHDSDLPGQHANGVAVNALRGVTNSLAIIDLGYDIEKNHGKDITDYFWIDKHTPEDFKDLMVEAAADHVVKQKVGTVSLLESTAGQNFGKLMQMRATVFSRGETTKVIPSEFSIQCSQDFDEEICPRCPMGAAPGGAMVVEISKYRKEVLNYAFQTPQEVKKDFRREQRLPKDCSRVNIEVTQMHTVEQAKLSSPIGDREGGQLADDRTRRSVFFLGKHDTKPNQTLLVTGKMFQNPKNNDNEFVVLDAMRVDDDLDKFELTDDMIEKVAHIQLVEGTADEKLKFISQDLSMNVTRIFARDDMHTLMDLAFHSVLEFPFQGTIERKGWLDVAIVGETRTGKSEAARRLTEFYKRGQVVNCENTSIAGLIGGMISPTSGGWEISWGTLPIHDRRLVVLDEASGLQKDQIGRLSEVRSAGIASIHKIDSSVEVYARTRLIWIANPRISSIKRGTGMISNLMGNTEDISRFDLAMSVHSDDPGLRVINDPDQQRAQTPLLTPEGYGALVMWAWTRKPEDIIWDEGVERYIFSVAIRMGRTFTESPPLVQEASVRFKIARLAIAIACRLFSTSDGRTVLVTRDHVDAARDLMLRLYKAPKFGYYSDSLVEHKRRQDSEEQYYETKGWLVSEPVLCDFLRQNSGVPFSPQNMRDIMGMAFGQVSTTISHLQKKGLIDLAHDSTSVGNNNTFVSTDLLRRLLEDIPA